jgi:predicted NBD/HSP70 family sugar kinase
MGVVLHGKVYYGSHFSAGEFCSVLKGEKGQGQFSLSLSQSELIPEDENVRRAFFEELARNVALLVNSFDLSHVFLGGDIEHYQTEAVAILSREIERNQTYPDIARRVIRVSSMGDQAVAFGAAVMFLDRLFTDVELMDGVDRFRTGGVTLLPGWQ